MIVSIGIETCFFSVLIYYLLTKVVNLEHKKFHLLMCALLTLSFTATGMFYTCFYYTTRSASEKLSAEKQFWVWTTVFATVNFVVIYVAHSIYVLKYWMIARKLDYILNEKGPLTDLSLKFNLAFYGIICYEVLMGLAYFYYFLNLEKAQQINPVNRLLIVMGLNSQIFFLFALKINAVSTVRNQLSELGINKTRVVLYFIAASTMLTGDIVSSLGNYNDTCKMLAYLLCYLLTCAIAQTTLLVFLFSTS